MTFLQLVLAAFIFCFVIIPIVVTVIQLLIASTEEFSQEVSKQEKWFKEHQTRALGFEGFEPGSYNRCDGQTDLTCQDCGTHLDDYNAVFYRSAEPGCLRCHLASIPVKEGILIAGSYIEQTRGKS